MKNIWCKFQCIWNWLLDKISFEVKNCPNKLCTCKK